MENSFYIDGSLFRSLMNIGTSKGSQVIFHTEGYNPGEIYVLVKLDKIQVIGKKKPLITKFEVHKKSKDKEFFVSHHFGKITCKEAIKRLWTISCYP